MQDYRGEAVTAANFLSVLAGEEPAVIGSSGRTIKSGPDDRVFVFYADHGAPGKDEMDAHAWSSHTWSWLRIARHLDLYMLHVN